MAFFTVLGITALVVGFVVPGLWSFTESVLATAAGLCFAVAIAIVLIEGPVLTREQRGREVAVYRWSIAQTTWEIAGTVAREFAQPYAEPAGVDLYGPERGNWEAFKPLLRTVFRWMQDPTVSARLNWAMSDHEYEESVDSTRLMVRRIVDAMDHKAEYRDQLGPLDLMVSRLKMLAERPLSERDYLERIGEIGDATIDLVEAIRSMYERAAMKQW